MQLFCREGFNYLDSGFPGVLGHVVDFLSFYISNTVRFVFQNCFVFMLCQIIFINVKPWLKKVFLIHGGLTGNFQTPDEQDSNLYIVNQQPTSPRPIPSIARPNHLWAWADAGPRSTGLMSFQQAKVRIQSFVRKSSSSSFPTCRQATAALSSCLTALKP